jgi:hypothetical protein
MLGAVPDLRQALTEASATQLSEIFSAFDVTITYDKENERLNLAATITPELIPDNKNDRPRRAVADVCHSGGEIETPTRDRVLRIEEDWYLNGRP